MYFENTCKIYDNPSKFNKLIQHSCSMNIFIILFFIYIFFQFSSSFHLIRFQYNTQRINHFIELRCVKE